MSKAMAVELQRRGEKITGQAETKLWHSAPEKQADGKSSYKMRKRKRE